MRIFTVMILAKNGNGEPLYHQIKDSFSGSLVSLVDNSARAQKLLETIVYQIVVCDLDFGKEGVELLRSIKKQHPGVKTIVSFLGDFVESCPEDVTFDELEFVEAVDCTWQLPATVERVVRTISSFFQVRERGFLISNLPFFDRAG